MDRFQLLLSSGVITEQTCEKAVRIQNSLADRFAQEEALDMFVTHYAMALERQNRQEIISGPDQAVFSEIVRSSHYPQACSLLQELDDLTQSEFPEPEQQFMIMHLVTLIDRNS